MLLTEKKQFWSNPLLFDAKYFCRYYMKGMLKTCFQGTHSQNPFKFIVWRIFEGTLQLTLKLIWCKDFQSIKLIFHYVPWSEQIFRNNIATTPVFWMFQMSCHGAAEESPIQHTESECNRHYSLKKCLSNLILMYVLSFWHFEWERKKWLSVEEEMKYTGKSQSKRSWHPLQQRKCILQHPRKFILQDVTGLQSITMPHYKAIEKTTTDPQVWKQIVV